MEEQALSSHPLRRQFKICLIGDGYVGKTSIRLKYLKGGFKRSYIPTLGVDFAQKLIQYDGVPTNLVIWDIAGQSLFESLRRRYYDGASGIILVYSVIDKVAFENAGKWLEEAKGYAKDLPPLIIIGNKIDLRLSNPPEETISTEEGREFALRISQRLNTKSVFIETSALTGENIDKAFESLVQLMLEELEKRRPGYIPKDTTPTPEAAPSTLIDLSRTEEPSSEETIQTTTTETPIVDTAMEDQTQMPEEQPEPVLAESTVSEPIVTTAPNETTTATTPMNNHTNEPEREIVSTAKVLSLDPVTTLPSDSDYLVDDEIGNSMGDLIRLREELRVAETELATMMSNLETTLLNLKNVIHVKKIMYEHLQEQLKTTRQEWSDAYDQYLLSEQRKSSEMDKRSKQIDELRKEIEKVGKKIRSRVDDLGMKRVTE